MIYAILAHKKNYALRPESFCVSKSTKQKVETFLGLCSNADADADDEDDYCGDLRNICDVDTNGDMYWNVRRKLILGVALAYHHY